MNWKTCALITVTLFILPLSTYAAQADRGVNNIQEQNNTMQIAQKIKHGRKFDRGERMNKLLENLDLTPEQSQQIKTIQAESQDTAEDLREQMKTEHQSIRSLFSSDATSEEIREQHQQVQATHEQLSNNRLETMLQIRETLTPEQRSQMAELMQQHQGRKFRR